MSDDLFSQVRRLFPELLQLAPEARASWLDERCGDDAALRAELESLVESHDSRPLAELGEAIEEVLEETRSAEPVRIGDYRVLEKIGQGGMGSVYLAEQETPRRRVAVKMIRGGFLSEDLMRRFVFEVDVLGQLQDPGIARIYEAGVAEVEDAEGGKHERPFFAMEHVDGRDLLAHAADAGLTTKQRLELVARVADAVEYAHKNGVIHRDLKPGNILVDERGRPKVLDFGVARANDGDRDAATLMTHAGQIVGTLPYMSPEQVSGGEGGLDTRSDVYALGVVLYELLVGRLPLDVRELPMAAAYDRIRDEDPEPLGVLDSRFRGDVETIVAKALAKEKERRYQSAADLAGDIRRYLSDQPILARPSSAAYQVKKFAKRHKGLVAGVALAVVALVGGIIATSLETVRANRNAKLASDREAEARRLLGEAREARDAEAAAARAAEEKRKEAIGVRHFFEEVLDLASPTKRGVDVKVVEALDEIVARLDEDEEFDTYRRFEPSIRVSVGMIYTKIGRFEHAEKNLRRSYEILREKIEGDDSVLIDAHFGLGRVCMKTSKLTEALEHFRAGLAMSERMGGSAAKYLGSRMLSLGAALRDSGDFVAARSAYETALDFYRGHEGKAKIGGIAASLGSLAEIDQREGDLPSASERFEESLRFMREHGKETSANYALVSFAYARVHVLRGKNEEALRLFRQALEVGAEAMGDQHPTLARVRVTVGEHLLKMNKPEEAEAVLDRARETLAGKPSTRAAFATALLASGMLYLGTDRIDEAEKAVLRAEEILDGIYGPTHPHTIAARRRVTDIRRAQGETEEAEQLIREILADVKEGSTSVPVFQRELAEVLMAQEKNLEEAEKLLLASRAGFVRIYGKDIPQVKGLDEMLERLRNLKKD